MNWIHLIQMTILLNFIQFCYAHKYSDDPDIYRDVPGFVTSRGFQSESYTVTTNDGYILTIFRIVNPYIDSDHLRPKPVLLWHGLAESAEKWLFNRKGWLNKNGIYSEDNGTVINNCHGKLTSTLAFTLSACGFDVWLANTRSNQYSNKHVNLSTEGSKYWEYTLTEVALYDIPVTVSHVLKVTKKENLSFICFSMSTTTSFILLSLRPQYERYFRPYIALAPVAFNSHITSIIGVFAPIEPLFRFTAFPLGVPPAVAELIGAFICGNKVFRIICLIFFDILSGKDLLNTDLVLSSRIYWHYYQNQNSDGFNFFNYGQQMNLELYNQTKPPSYPLHRIKLKEIYLFQGLNDKLADPTDIKRLYDLIPNVKLLRTNPWSRWSHLDVGQARFENKFQDFAILHILQEYN